MMQAILITVLMFSCVSCDLYLKRIEESDVETCGRFDICNIVHKPHWGINSVEKLCRCPEGSFCPATFSNDDKQSLPVNPRTQMKFCTPIDQLYADLQPCEPGEIAIHVSKLYNVTQLDKVLNASSTLQCSCENINPIYWKYNSRYGKSLNENGTLFNIVDNFECTGKWNSSCITKLNVCFFRTQKVQCKRVLWFLTI